MDDVEGAENIVDGPKWFVVLRTKQYNRIVGLIREVIASDCRKSYKT